MRQLITHEVHGPDRVRRCVRGWVLRPTSRCLPYALTWQLDQIIEWWGETGRLRCDNGPGFISYDLEQWADRHGNELKYIQPGNLQQNTYAERYSRTVRYSWLSQYQFE